MYKNKEGKIIFDNPLDEKMDFLYKHFLSNSMAKDMKYKLSGDLLNKKDEYNNLTYHDLLLFITDLLIMNPTQYLLHEFVSEVLEFLNIKYDILNIYTTDIEYIDVDLLLDVFYTISLVNSNLLWSTSKLYNIEVDSYDEDAHNTYTISFKIEDTNADVLTTFIINTTDRYYTINIRSLMNYNSTTETSSFISTLKKVPVRDIVYGIRRPKIMINKTIKKLFNDVIDTLSDGNFM